MSGSFHDEGARRGQRVARPRPATASPLRAASLFLVDVDRLPEAAPRVFEQGYLVEVPVVAGQDAPAATVAVVLLAVFRFGGILVSQQQPVRAQRRGLALEDVKAGRRVAALVPPRALLAG